MKHILAHVRPGLTGIGSVIFRDEEELLSGVEDPVALHHDVFMPYKAELEEWYIAHNTIGTYFKLILVTAVAVILPRSTLVWRVFPDLPPPPEQVAKMLNYPSKE
ncbi:MAG: hypothetical protein D6751_05425 [Deltaproteobacteria bacterium]|nr:MAG: hypothetical protein D6751_05425 [Deltaproteobacteria bacterium]